jgi:membrane protease subunit HflK
MNFQNRTLRWASLPERIRGMFNLNDPRWGRGEDNKSDEGGRQEDRPSGPPAGPRGGEQAAGRVTGRGRAAVFSLI